MMVQGQLDEAEQAMRQPYHRSVRLGDRINAAVSGCNLGILMGTTGRDRRGAATLQAAMPILEELGHHHNLAWAWVEQAPLPRRLGHQKRAVAQLQKALERARELPDPRLEGRTLAELALWDSLAGRHSRAIRRAEKDRKLLLDSGDHLNLLVAIGSLGWVLSLAGRQEEAGLYLREGGALVQRLQLSERSPWALQWVALRERTDSPPSPA